ncbi:hypothetical protein MC885_002988 [Smutsia gigantea]|nr:hypothetical protein MC885_002988 [Smutsia gigantea]
MAQEHRLPLNSVNCDAGIDQAAALLTALEENEVEVQVVISNKTCIEIADKSERRCSPHSSPVSGLQNKSSQ